MGGVLHYYREVQTVIPDAPKATIEHNNNPHGSRFKKSDQENEIRVVCLILALGSSAIYDINTGGLSYSFLVVNSAYCIL